MNRAARKRTLVDAMRRGLDRWDPPAKPTSGTVVPVSFMFAIRWRGMTTHRYSVVAEGTSLTLTDENGVRTAATSQPGAEPSRLTIVLPDLLVQAGVMPKGVDGIEFVEGRWT